MKKANKSQTSKKEALLLERAKGVITHQLIGSLSLLLMGVMVFNTMNMVQAVNSGASQLNLTISPGELAIDSVGATVVFPSATEGTPSNVYQNLNSVSVRDFRSTANYEWDLKMYSAPLTGVTDSNYTIANSSIKVWPGNATIINIQTYDNVNMVGRGANNTSLSSDFIIFNAIENNSGIVAFNSTGLRVTTAGTESDQIYAGNATLTVIAS